MHSKATARTEAKVIFSPEQESAICKGVNE